MVFADFASTFQDFDGSVIITLAFEDFAQMGQTNSACFSILSADSFVDAQGLAVTPLSNFVVALLTKDDPNLVMSIGSPCIVLSDFSFKYCQCMSMFLHRTRIIPVFTKSDSYHRARDGNLNVRISQHSFLNTKSSSKFRFGSHEVTSVAECVTNILKRPYD